MLSTRTVLLAFSIVLMTWVAGAIAQNFPNKPIRIVVGGTGGSADFSVRLVAPELSNYLGQPVIVDNRTSGVIQGVIVAGAPPDGYTLLMQSSIFWLGPLMHKTPFDPVKDYSPITWLLNAPNILVVPSSFAANSAKEVIAVARQRPGELNYASTSSGASNHLAAELFKAMAGVNIVRVNYKSSGTAITDVVGGRVQMMFATPPGVASHIKAGRLKALAITSGQPSTLLPGVPTVAASGLPGYESGSRAGVFAPAKTSAVIVNRLNQGLVHSLKSTEVRERFFNIGVETVGSSPKQLADMVDSEITRLGRVIKDAGITGE